jgi:hypothetical protein
MMSEYGFGSLPPDRAQKSDLVKKEINIRVPQNLGGSSRRPSLHQVSYFYKMGKFRDLIEDY